MVGEFTLQKLVNIFFSPPERQLLDIYQYIIVIATAVTVRK